MLSIFCISVFSFLLPSINAVPLLSRRQTTAPQYVLDYAPMLYLHSQEQYMPSDIASQLVHTFPDVDDVPLNTGPNPSTLDNLATLNEFGNGGASIYLTSDEGIEALPSWLHGIVPDSSGLTRSATSSAIITVSKSGNILDAFYFYFYAYNQGDHVLNQPLLEFGDHIGDWEHNMVRFVSGVPQAVWYSQHSSGEAFAYAAVEKYQNDIRPVVYVANGTHANYAIAGAHDHTIPGLNLPVGPLEDQTDAGHLWDPALSAGSFVFSYDESSNTYSAYEPSIPTNWLSFVGHWGDEQLPASTPGQVDFFGLEYKYVSGPTGPLDKRLNRTAVCLDSDGCLVRPVLTS